MKTLNFGIEIETVGLNKLALANAIQRVVGGVVHGDANRATVTMADGRVWRAVSDGSLSGSINGEVVSPILTYADLEPLQNVVRALRGAGARADDSCGIHYAWAVAMRSPCGKSSSGGPMASTNCA